MVTMTPDKWKRIRWAAIKSGFGFLVFVIALTQWMTYARVIRAETLAVKEELYVVAARAVGARTPRTLVKHVLPQVLPSAIALATLNVSFVIRWLSWSTKVNVLLPKP